MQKRKKKIIVTGGAGFIGSHLVDALIKKNFKVVVIDKKMKWLNPKAKYYKMSVVSPKLCDVIKKEKPEYIFHLAAQASVAKSVADPRFDAEENIIGSINILECCKKSKVKKVIFSSTGGAIYGNTAKPPTSEKQPAQPEAPYGMAKYATELYLELYKKLFGIDSVSLRYSNVFGPRQDSSGEAGVVAIFSNRLLKGKTAVIYGNGRQTRDFIYVDDVVRANLVAMRKKCSGSINIGTGKETSINSIFKTVRKYTGSKQPEIHGPLPDGEIKRSALDTKKARRVLDWKPKTSIDAGLKKTVEWFKKNG